MASREIKTFVMFDTETTGLRSPGNDPKITELCFIAITRDELVMKQTRSKPRVLNKLSICINPGKPISPKASEVSGLQNDDLTSMPSFETQASLVTTFLKNLQQPACLVAHNGNRFDFPLLVSELQTEEEDKKKIPDVLCADSLEAFKALDDDDDSLPQNAENGATPPNLKRKSYSLSAVYARMFGQQPEEVHTAENDCLKLLKIVSKILQKFLQWCDQNALPLKDV